MTWLKQLQEGGNETAGRAFDYFSQARRRFTNIRPLNMQIGSGCCYADTSHYSLSSLSLSKANDRMPASASAALQFHYSHSMQSLRKHKLESSSWNLLPSLWTSVNKSRPHFHSFVSDRDCHNSSSIQWIEKPSFSSAMTTDKTCDDLWLADRYTRTLNTIQVRCGHKAECT